ncbi:MAG: hypothetical protein HRU70_07335 [Phycisphaeraceae bacterium]|nr:MAG: hypothetical protein HRU70_07335 [Phycisphaeraceae bacterium]
MGKGEHYSSYQRKVINRFYEHADTRHLTRVQELVSEIYLSAAEGKAGKAWEGMWAKAGEALAKVGATPAQVARAIGSKDPKALAAVVGEVAGRLNGGR